MNREDCSGTLFMFSLLLTLIAVGLVLNGMAFFATAVLFAILLFVLDKIDASSDIFFMLFNLLYIVPAAVDLIPIIITKGNGLPSILAATAIVLLIVSRLCIMDLGTDEGPSDF